MRLLAFDCIKKKKKKKKLEDAELLQALLNEDDAQTQQQLADQLNVRRKAVFVRLKAMGKIQKLEKLVPLKLNGRCRKTEKILANAARLVQKNTISPSNCDWR